MSPYHSILQGIDTHTEGEATRILTGGLPPLDGATMAERLQCLRRDHDHLRTALVREPRGHDGLVLAYLLPAERDGADAGVVFANDVGYLGMCGHGAIGVATALVTTGQVNVVEPETEVTLDTPAGRVQMFVLCAQGQPKAVRLTNVPSFVQDLDVIVPVEGLGKVKVDIAYGGNWFGFVDVGELEIDIDNLQPLMEKAKAVRKAMAAHGIVGRDPMTGATAPVDHLKLTTTLDRHSARALTLCPGNSYDRSPCGTGTSAKLAVLHARGQLEVGETFTSRSILDTSFTGVVRSLTNVGDLPAVVPEITGSAYVTAYVQFVLDPDDPLRFGIGTGS